MDQARNIRASLTGAGRADLIVPMRRFLSVLAFILLLVLLARRHNLVCLQRRHSFRELDHLCTRDLGIHFSASVGPWIEDESTYNNDCVEDLDSDID
jgi:hypothetical protein